MGVKDQTRGNRAIRWIEEYCVVPSGERKGQHVRLTNAEREIIRMIYDHRKPERVTGPLAAFLSLLHLCGPEYGAAERSHCMSDLLSVWNATGPDLKEVLKRDGEQIACPELGTKYPAAA